MTTKQELKIKVKRPDGTIRDATPQEVMAWHILQSVNACELIACRDCFVDKHSACLCDQMISDDSADLLKGKEIILDVTE